jgi:hypothetical protein
MTGNLTINSSGAYPLRISSTQRYQLQVLNSNNTVNSGYGWWWFTDTNFNMGFHADGAADRFTLTRDGNLTITGTIGASNFSGTSSGTNTGDQTTITGNAGTATTFSTGRTNYKGVTDNAVAGQLMWKNYGNSHTMFDASAGTSPDGGAVSRFTPDYPVENNASANTWGYNINLMGWNGGNTFGVKVDYARYANSSGNSSTVTNGVYTNASMNTLSGVLNFGSTGATPYSNPTGTSNGIAFGGIESSSLRQYGIFTEQENIGGNYSKLTFNYHTGIRLGASPSYGGTRFYNDAINGTSTVIFSVGNGDNHVRVANNLIVSGTSSATTLSASGNVVVNSGNNLSSSSGGLTFWDNGGTTTSWVGFKNNASSGWSTHGGSTSTGAYSTYFIMDTASRGWIWRFASVGGTDFSGTNVASIQNNNGAMSLGSNWDGSASKPIFAQLNVCQGLGSATNYRDIDLRGSWAGGEGHSITATHGSSSVNIVGQITFQHDGPGSRIKFGKLYHSGDQSTYPMELISSGSSGNLYVTGDITAYYSDERLKTKVAGIDNALDKVLSLSGFKYVNNDLAKEHGYNSDKVQIGMSAQEVQKIAPEIVKLAHFDMEIINGEVASKSGENYLTLDYSKLVPILVEAIKEQQAQIEDLKKALFNVIDNS